MNYSPPNRYVNLGAANAALVKAGPTNVYSLYVHNENAAVQYLLLCDKATAPANTDIPVDFFAIPATSGLLIGSEYFTPAGLKFLLGLGWAWSSTKDVVTVATATEQSLRINYV